MYIPFHQTLSLQFYTCLETFTKLLAFHTIIRGGNTANILILSCIELNINCIMRDFFGDWLITDLNLFEMLDRSVRKCVCVLFTEMTEVLLIIYVI